MKKILNPTVLFIFISAFYWGCKKDQHTLIDDNLATENQQLIANAKSYFKDSINIEIGSNVSSQNPRKNAKIAEWDSASIVQLSIGKAVLIPVIYNKPFYVSGNISGYAHYNINQLAQLLIYRDSSKKYHAELVTFLPDSNFTGYTKYSGFVFVEDWKCNTIKRYKIEKDERIYKFVPDTVASNYTIRQQNLQQPDAQVVQICNIFYGYNYSPSLNEGYTYVEETCGYNIIFDEIHITNIPKGDDYANIGAQTGTASSYIDAKQNIVDGKNLEFEFDNDTPPIDITFYFNCFDNVPDIGATYSVKLCADL
ncbi:MAG TPA: hypothetical protein VHZ50_17045, partial [Puia sp.]|nr:hypothetical protein [Puia sp.]